jgi:hypothetical protein
MATTTNFGWETPDDTDLVKDGAAAIRTALGGVDTSFVDLKGGTTGQVLAKASGTDLDFIWSNDAAGMTNPMTTTGDTIYSSSGSTPARLGIGTAGQVLQVNSGATAPEWATPTPSGDSWSLINAGGTALTGAATITVSGISGKNSLFIIISGASCVNASSQFAVRFNGDTGDNYDSFGMALFAESSYNSSNIFKNRNVVGGSRIALGSPGPSAQTASGYLLATGTNTTGVKMCQGTLSGSNGSDSQIFNVGGFYSGSSTISSVSLVSDNGNFDAGSIFVYASA